MVNAGNMHDMGYPPDAYHYLAGCLKQCRTMVARIKEYRRTGDEFNWAYNRYTLTPRFTGVFVSDVERLEPQLSEEERQEEKARKWQDLALKVAEDTYHMARYTEGLIAERSRHNYEVLFHMAEKEGRDLGKEGAKSKARLGLS